MFALWLLTVLVLTGALGVPLLVYLDDRRRSR